MQIHQNPMPNHPIAHMEAEDMQPTTQSKMVTIQHIQADSDLERPVEKERGLEAPTMNAQEVWSKESLNKPWEDSLGWEAQTDDTWDS